MKIKKVHFHWSWLALALLLVAEVVFFRPYLQEFLTPDGIFYVARPIQHGEDWSKLFFHLDDRDNYRPLTYVIATPLTRLAGLSPAPYHWFELIGHWIITGLVFYLAWLLLKDYWAAWASAAIFGLHGAAAYVVFDITFLPDVSLAFFYLLALIFFVKYLGRRNVGYFLASLVAFFLSLLCKEPAVTLPAVLTLLVLLMPELREGDNKSYSWGLAIKTTALFWAVAIVYLIWFGLLSQGKFVPTDPTHPYFIDLSSSSISAKKQYLEWGFNFPGPYGQMGAHEKFRSLGERILPASLHMVFQQASDFYLYLIGPAWILMMLASGKGPLVMDHLAAYLLTPLVFLAVLLMIRALFQRGVRNRPACAGIFLFVLLLAPVLILPRDKTMVHNLYMAVAGLAFWAGASILHYRHSARSAWQSWAAWYIPVVLLLAGTYSINRQVKEGWPIVSAWKSEGYLEDMRRLYPTLPENAVLHFEKTGNPRWPWFTDAGNLLRLNYRNPQLIVAFADYGALPTVGPGRILIRLKEVSGHLINSQLVAAETIRPLIELMRPEEGQYRMAGSVSTNPQQYRIRDNELFFDIPVEKGMVILLPLDFRLTYSSLPCLVSEEADGRISLQLSDTALPAQSLSLRARKELARARYF